MIKEFIFGNMSIYRSFLLFIAVFLLLHEIPYFLLNLYYDQYFSEICPQINDFPSLPSTLEDCEPTSNFARIIDSRAFLMSAPLVILFVSIGAFFSAVNNIKSKPYNIVPRILASCIAIIIVLLSFRVLDFAYNMIVGSMMLDELIKEISSSHNYSSRQKFV